MPVFENRRMGSKTRLFPPLTAGIGFFLSACAPNPAWILRSPDRKHEARVIATPKAQRVFIDGKNVGEHSSVAIQNFAFSQDGRQWAYAAHAGAGWALRTSHGELGVWDGLGEMLFSPDGSRLAVQTEQDRRWSVRVYDFTSHHKSTGIPFDALLAGSLQFGNRGRRIAYVAKRGRFWHPILDTALGPAWDGLSDLQWTAGGNGCAYIAQRGSNAYAVVDGKEWGPYADLRDLRYSQDSLPPRYAFVARIGDAEAIVQSGGQVLAAFPSVRRQSLRFWPGHRDPVFVATLPEGGEALHVDGLAEKAYRKISEPRSDLSGQHWGYAARDSIAWVLSIDGHEYGRYPWVSDPAFGRGGVFAFAIVRDSGMAVQSGGNTYAFDFLFEDTLIFDREGLHWGCVAGDAKSRRFFFVRDGQKLGELDLKEIAGITLQAPLASQTHRLRDWMAAELERANRP